MPNLEYCAYCHMEVHPESYYENGTGYYGHMCPWCHYATEPIENEK